MELIVEVEEGIMTKIIALNARNYRSKGKKKSKKEKMWKDRNVASFGMDSIGSS